MSIKLSKNLDENLKIIKEDLKDSSDVVFREILIGGDLKAAFVLVDGLSFMTGVSDFVIEDLLGKLGKVNMEENQDNLLEYLQEQAFSFFEVKAQEDLDIIYKLILSGETLFLLDGRDKGLVLGTRFYPVRSVDEPATETLIRGPRDGFTESLRMNTALVRRRVRDTRFKIVSKEVGTRSKTDIALMYIEDIVDSKILREVHKRIDNIDIDAILDSSMLEHLIEDNYLSPFPQMENTERPDSVASGLFEGRVCIIVDNSPFALMIPGTLGTLLQSSEDHYSRWLESSFVRILRVIALGLVLFSSSLYISITAFNPGLLPTRLIYYIGASRINVPFPAVIEAMMMEIIMEVIRQAGTRISGPIGSTIGIVGGLIIGQAAVEAGIVSSLMIIVVAVTTVATFAIPSYELSAALRILRFVFMILAGFFGLYGIILGVLLLGSHIIVLDSFTIPYASPYSGLGIEEGDIKDTLVKSPIQKLWRRPAFTNPKNKRRYRGGEDES